MPIFLSGGVLQRLRRAKPCHQGGPILPGRFQVAVFNVAISLDLFRNAGNFHRRREVGA